MPHKISGNDAKGGNTSLLNGDHVMGKPRRAPASMRRGTDYGVYLGGDPRRLLGIDMGAAAECRATRPAVAPVALELHGGVSLAEVLRHPVYGDIRPACHVVVQADGLALQAVQARGGGHRKSTLSAAGDMICTFMLFLLFRLLVLLPVCTRTAGV